jgi:hypothetical protein
MTSKCVERLCFVDAKSGKVKQGFEVEFTNKEVLSGRRSQLVKKIVGRALDEGWLKPSQLFGYLKRNRKLNVLDLLNYAYGDDKDEA